MGDFFCAVVGVFLCKDDSHFFACHQFLSKTCFQMCASAEHGGRHCVEFFLWISVLNVVFMTFRISSGGPFLLLSFICQMVGSLFACQLRTLLIQNAIDTMPDNQPMNQHFPFMPSSLRQGAMGGGMPGGGGVAGGTGNVGRPGGGGPVGGGPRNGPTNFVPFQGVGQRLDN
mmetsp:Transcript_15017/g.23946  ORF Transcript_15017/g.23946 Transcript_15017/m.23946 type:complete len:172 (-) Transcript_15017:19-534(-)